MQSGTTLGAEYSYNQAKNNVEVRSQQTRTNGLSQGSERSV